MSWVSVELTFARDVDEAILDVLSECLLEEGAAGIELRGTAELRKIAEAHDLRVEHRGVTLVASFGPDVPPDAIPELVDEVLESVGVTAASVQVRTEEPIDWATHWRRHFHPLQFGRLWIVPTWLEPPPDAQVILRMDPGMAFGTGSHETTALCLERISELSPIESILDVGTGTGVLALAALALGAPSAVGTDNDPDALTIAAENAALNGLSGRLELSPASPRRLGRQFAVVVANILADPLIQLAPEIAPAVAPGGRLLLSGVLSSQADRVAEAYEALGLVRRAIVTRGEWARIDLDASASGVEQRP